MLGTPSDESFLIDQKVFSRSIYLWGIYQNAF